MISRKSQANSIFIYILALVIIAGIFFLGYKMISSVSKTASDAELQAFVKGFQNDANGIIAEYDNIRTFEKAVPMKYTSVCFADTTPARRNTIMAAGPGADINAYAIINDSISSNSANNVFIIDGQIVAFKIKGLRLSAPPYYKCYPNTGTVSYTLQGKGEYVLLIIS